MVYKLGEKLILYGKARHYVTVHASRAVNPVVFTVDEKPTVPYENLKFIRNVEQNHRCTLPVLLIL